MLHPSLPTWSLSLAVLLASAGVARPAERPPAVLDLEGREVDPLASGPKATVLLFVRTDCPVSNRYAPEVRRLHHRFAGEGVAFWLVYPDPDESPATIRQHLEEYGYPMAALRDPDHTLVAAAGARVTPEAAVFVPGPGKARLVYHGRIDNRQVDFGKERPAPTTRDLEDALSAILAGRAVSHETAPAVGCFIADTR